MSECDIYLEFETPEHQGDDAVSLRLPVLPEQLAFTRAGDNVSTSTVKHGEVNVLRKPKLITFQIDSFFPRTGERRQRRRDKGDDFFHKLISQSLPAARFRFPPEPRNNRPAKSRTYPRLCF